MFVHSFSPNSETSQRAWLLRMLHRNWTRKRDTRRSFRLTCSLLGWGLWEALERAQDWICRPMQETALNGFALEPVRILRQGLVGTRYQTLEAVLDNKAGGMGRPRLSGNTISHYENEACSCT